MGDLNGHIGLDGKRVNVNGQMILKFAGNKLKVKNWELENPTTWQEKQCETAIDYILVNDRVQNIDISDHIMIGITCGTGTTKIKGKRKGNLGEKWKLKRSELEKDIKES